MSYAPQTLLDARDYLKRHTGLSLAALGIVGDTAHTYGYHLGRDRTNTSDYSRQTARDKAGLSNAASALDIGTFTRLRALTAHMVAEARAGRLGDVRELIGPWSDGRAYRWDHLSGWSAQQRSRGDSHEWHLHISYYRDSEGRSKTAPFRTFFEPTTEEDDMTPQEMMAARVNYWDEGKNRPWWAGQYITTGSKDISVHQAFMYSAMTPFYVRKEVLPQLAAAKKRDEAILAAVKGVDTETILDRIDQRAAEDAARDAAIVQLLEQHSDGTIDAEAVVRKLGELLTAAADEQP